MNHEPAKMWNDQHCPRLALRNYVDGMKIAASNYVDKSMPPRAVSESYVDNRHASRPQFYKSFAPPFLPDPAVVALDRTNAGFLRMTMNVVEKHLANCEFNVGMLARDLRISRRQLFRKFQAFISRTPNAFIRDMRLNRAAQLLRDSQMTILEITYAVGFCDARYFRNVFREKFGMLPSVYAKQFDCDLPIPNK